MNEAVLLSAVQHKNVVRLYGYCADDHNEKLLVYEYVPNESLDKILFRESSDLKTLILERESLLCQRALFPMQMRRRGEHWTGENDMR